MELLDTLPSASDLRHQAYQFMELATTTFDPQLKRGLLGCAFAISQLAECIDVKLG